MGLALIRTQGRTARPRFGAETPAEELVRNKARFSELTKMIIDLSRMALS
jgi:hypothetical protein